MAIQLMREKDQEITELEQEIFALQDKMKKVRSHVVFIVSDVYNVRLAQRSPHVRALPTLNGRRSPTHVLSKPTPLRPRKAPWCAWRDRLAPI